MPGIRAGVNQEKPCAALHADKQSVWAYLLDGVADIFADQFKGPVVEHEKTLVGAEIQLPVRCPINTSNAFIFKKIDDLLLPGSLKGHGIRRLQLCNTPACC